jgi:hypothetical protein
MIIKYVVIDTVIRSFHVRPRAARVGVVLVSARVFRVGHHLP